MARHKVGDLVYETPQSPGKVREVLPNGDYVVEWLTKDRGTTQIRWGAKNFTEYVEKLERKYKKYQKKLDQLRNRA